MKIIKAIAAIIFHLILGTIILFPIFPMGIMCIILGFQRAYEIIKT